jgi:hypothetical protein
MHVGSRSATAIVVAGVGVVAALGLGVAAPMQATSTLLVAARSAAAAQHPTAPWAEPRVAVTRRGDAVTFELSLGGAYLPATITPDGHLIWPRTVTRSMTPVTRLRSSRVLAEYATVAQHGGVARTGSHWRVV